MSFIAKYIANTLSRIHLSTPSAAAMPSTSPSTSPSPAHAHILTTSTAALLSASPSPTHARGPAFPRGLVLTTVKPCLKAPVASPKLMLELAATPSTHAPANTSATSGSSFDISLISDTSTNSPSSSDDEHNGLLALSTLLASHPQNVGHEIDLFSPRSAYSDSSSSPCRLVGLGISGIPRKDGKRDEFDGLGLVGVRHSYYRNPFMADDEEDDGYTSPTPRRFHGHEDEADADEWVEEDVSDAVLSEAFLQELVYTWEADPMHMRFLATIPECAPEDEEDIIRKPLVMPAPPPVAARMNNTTIRSNNCRKLRTQAAPAVSAATRGRSAVRTGSSSGSASRRDKAMVSRGVSCAVARSRRG